MGLIDLALRNVPNAEWRIVLGFSFQKYIPSLSQTLHPLSQTLQRTSRGQTRHCDKDTPLEQTAVHIKRLAMSWFWSSDQRDTQLNVASNPRQYLIPVSGTCTSISNTLIASKSFSPQPWKSETLSKYSLLKKISQTKNSLNLFEKILALLYRTPLPLSNCGT